MITFECCKVKLSSEGTGDIIQPTTVTDSLASPSRAILQKEAMVCEAAIPITDSSCQLLL